MSYNLFCVDMRAPEVVRATDMLDVPLPLRAAALG